MFAVLLLKRVTVLRSVLQIVVALNLQLGVTNFLTVAPQGKQFVRVTTAIFFE